MTSEDLLGTAESSLRGSHGVCSLGAENFSSKTQAVDSVIEGLKVYLQDTLGLSYLLGVDTPTLEALPSLFPESEILEKDLTVVLETELSGLPPKESELLTRILEAGLKVSMSRVHWLSVPAGSNLIEFLNNAIGRDLSSRTPLLVFGEGWDGIAKEQGQFGQLFAVQNLQVLVTHGLREISESESVKREAWAHLQKLKGLIPKG